MSQENVETVQRVIEAWNADDLDAFLAELVLSDGKLLRGRTYPSREEALEALGLRG